MEELNDDDSLTPLPPRLTGRRPSFSPVLDDDGLQHLPALKRAATTGSTTLSSSSRDESINPYVPHWASPSSSLLSAQRPGFTEAYETNMKLRRFQSDTLPKAAEDPSPTAFTGEPQSPEDGTNLKRSLEINMKDLVGDAVGNMSISPSSRDIVLAARKGLFIIDLEHPLEVPRFLPQGGTWDVADVQWNPHSQRSQYIVSTSSEKMLIWNLGITGKTSIEHILKSHYRAITDFNWHNSEYDVVASTGIDSWIWVWDLRQPRRPTLGLSAFKASGTQVKWNRGDGNYLASAHGNEVFIWDRRKGSLPVTQIPAHSAKIYGIDWSHHLRNEIVTCSLDKTIKTWDINEPGAPKSCIETDYPVWRARNLPFGQGFLSLPQRGVTRLEMYARGPTPTLVETFEGHLDVVKEFVWRKGAQDEFQLITWSKDRTLRFWPVTNDVMQRVGYTPQVTRGRSQRVDRPPTLSYRDPPENPNPEASRAQLLSAPVGNRSILAEVRAGPPPRNINLITHPHLGSSARAAVENNQRTPTLTDTKPIAMGIRNRGGTMSRGAVTGKSVGMDAFAWLANVKVGGKRGSSSGTGSVEPTESTNSSTSRLGSVSRGHSRSREASESSRNRSVSRTRGGEERSPGDNSQSLQEEITTTLTKFAASKIKLEKFDLGKRRSCTLGLHGPWGEKSSVFLRVTFTFPPKYPQALHPEGTPTVELERNPLIPTRIRIKILKGLRYIRENKRPCLEPCLRWLLFADERMNGGVGLADSESSDDDEVAPRGKEKIVSIMRTNKNMAEPRTSQRTFGPNGELISFSIAPPRTFHQESRLFQSPALVSDAIRRLRSSAKDKRILPPKAENDLHILRAMTNLLTVPQHTIRRDQSGNAKNPSAPRNVFIMSSVHLPGPEKELAVGYVFEGDGLAEVCEANAEYAKLCGRYDHERIFRMMRSLFRAPPPTSDDEEKDVSELKAFVSDALAITIVEKIYEELAAHKDIQMLAMVSAIVLQTPHGRKKQPALEVKQPQLSVAAPPPLKTNGMDYFTLARAINQAPSPLSPAWPSPVAPPTAPSVASSTSSRGSWSSLFGSGSVRQLGQFVAGFQDGLTTPTEIPGLTSFFPEPISKQNSIEKIVLHPATAIQRKRSSRKDSPMLIPAANTSKSWNEGQPNTATSLSVSFSSAGHKRSGLLRVKELNPRAQDRPRVVFEPAIVEESPPPEFSAEMLQQFHRHVYVYAELLFRWQLFHQRIELLKTIDHLEPSVDDAQHRIDIVRRCARPECAMLLDERTQKGHVCGHCNTPVTQPACGICRLPVKGISRSCLRCYHVTHPLCWEMLDFPLCPTGCGCVCAQAFDDSTTRPSTRLGISPTSNSLNLPTGISMPHFDFRDFR